VSVVFWLGADKVSVAEVWGLNPTPTLGILDKPIAMTIPGFLKIFMP
jgi:hypothetical protein